MQNHYDTLGVSMSSSPEDIKAAFKTLAKKYHPDLNPNDPSALAKFQSISNAYDVLSDPIKKANYDLTINPQSYQTSNPFRSSGGMFDEFIWNIFEDALSQKNGQRYYSTFRQYGSNPQKPTRNQNIRVIARIDLDNVFDEHQMYVTLTEESNDVVQITVPKGVFTGCTVTYKGKGSKKFKDLEPGDLEVNFIVRTPDDVKVVRNDLYINAQIDSLSAIVGGVARLKITEKRVVNLTVPQGTQNGQNLRLEGMGVPDFKDNTKSGDLFVHVTLSTPTNLNQVQLDLIRTIIKARV